MLSDFTFWLVASFGDTPGPPSVLSSHLDFIALLAIPSWVILSVAHHVTARKVLLSVLSLRLCAPHRRSAPPEHHEALAVQIQTLALLSLSLTLPKALLPGQMTGSIQESGITTSSAAGRGPNTWGHKLRVNAHSTFEKRLRPRSCSPQSQPQESVALARLI